MCPKSKKDDKVSLQVDSGQLEQIEKAKLEKEEREKEEERIRNVESLKRHTEKEQARKKKEAEPVKEEKEEELEVDGTVKQISLVFLLIATIFGGLASVGMIAAEIYLVNHFDLCFVCYIIIVIQSITIVAGTISKWINWYLKTRHVKMGED